MEKLAALFGNSAFVRITRLFLLHPTTSYSTKTLREKTRVTIDELRPVIRDLSKAGVVKKRNGKTVLNTESSFLPPLRELLIGQMLGDIHLAKRLAKAGAIKLLIASGVFIDNAESRIDILIVADRLDLKGLRKIITTLESDVGQEVRYTAFTPTEFSYRLGVNDKLVRDILDYPHEKLVNKILQ